MFLAGDENVAAAIGLAGPLCLAAAGRTALEQIHQISGGHGGGRFERDDCYAFCAGSSSPGRLFLHRSGDSRVVDGIKGTAAP